MRRLTLFVVLIAFTFSCGGQWPALQCVAWANMIREYSEMVPLTQAVQMTFSGEYPCSLCKAIAEKKNSDQQQKALALKKHEKKVVSSLLSFEPRTVTVSSQTFVSLAQFFEPRSEAPPTPPPRLA